jgi:small conductance mechanosensitive channel
VPSVEGVESLSYGVAVLQITARCAPNEHYAVQREIRTRVKAAFDREGIDMAATQTGPGPAGGEQR